MAKKKQTPEPQEQQNRTPFTVEELAQYCYAGFASESAGWPAWSALKASTQAAYTAATAHVAGGDPPRSDFERYVATSLK